MDDTEFYARNSAIRPGQRTSVNPYFITLWVVLGLCILIGVILLSVGNNLAGNTFNDPGAGLGQIVWGGAILGLAVTTAIVMLGAAAARWNG